MRHAILAFALLAGAARAASVDAIVQNETGNTELHRHPIAVLAVDGKLRGETQVRLTPGTHLLTMVSLKKVSGGTRVQQQVPFTAEPCMRYFVLADHGEATRDDWSLVLVRKEPRAGCDPAAYTPPPPPQPRRFLGFDFELSMLGDRVAVALIGERCGEITGDAARGAAAIARWEAQNGADVDAVARRVQAMVISRGSIGGYERAVQTLQLFEEGIAERREAVLAETLGSADLATACAAALATLEKRVDVYDRSLEARKTVKAAREYNKKYGAEFGPMVDKNWANLVEDADISGGYWRKP